MTFEEFATDHGNHNHCSGCKACILDPHPIVQSQNVWCVICRDRILAVWPKDLLPPWGEYGWADAEFAKNNSQYGKDASVVQN